MYSNRQHQIEYSRADCNGDEAGKRAAYNGGPNYRMVSFSAACTHRAISSEAHQSVVFRHGLTLPSMEMVKAHHEFRRSSVIQLTHLKTNGRAA